MSTKSVILSVLSKEELVDLAAALFVGTVREATMPRLRAAIEASEGATLDAILAALTVDELRRALAALGLPTNGYMKRGLVERILAAAANAASSTVSHEHGRR